jgi:hypothetical protein
MSPQVGSTQRVLLTRPLGERGRSEPLRLERLHQRGAPAIVLPDLCDVYREISTATTSFIQLGHCCQRRGNARVELGVGIPQVVLERRPVQICSGYRPSLGPLRSEFLPRPARTIAVGGLPGGVHVFLAKRELDQNRPRAGASSQFPRMVKRPGAFGFGAIVRGGEVQQ